VPSGPNWTPPPTIPIKKNFTFSVSNVIIFDYEPATSNLIVIERGLVETWNGGTCMCAYAVNPR
jgi:hypothetical protein